MLFPPELGARNSAAELCVKAEELIWLFLSLATSKTPSLRVAGVKDFSC